MLKPAKFRSYYVRKTVILKFEATIVWKLYSSQFRIAFGCV